MTATEIIQRLGGATKTAALCEVSIQAVSQWNRNGIPKARLQFLQLARPDVFPKQKRVKAASQPQ